MLQIVAEVLEQEIHSKKALLLIKREQPLQHAVVLISQEKCRRVYLLRGYESLSKVCFEVRERAEHRCLKHLSLVTELEALHK